MRNALNRWTVLPTVLLALAVAGVRSSAAQAVPVGTRGSDVAPFFAVTTVSPDWGASRNFGYTAGVDYTRLSRGVGQPGLEFRVSSATGLRVDEFSYAGGLKLQGGSYGPVRPYATMLVGMGTINIHPGGPSLAKETSFLYALGGGLEIQLPSAFKVKADFLQQTWSFSPNGLTPVALSIGLSYSLPVRNGGFRQ